MTAGRKRKQSGTFYRPGSSSVFGAAANPFSIAGALGIFGVLGLLCTRHYGARLRRKHVLTHVLTSFHAVSGGRSFWRAK